MSLFTNPATITITTLFQKAARTTSFRFFVSPSRPIRRSFFGIYRSDFHGNQFWIPKVFTAKRDAKRHADRLEALAHKQAYFVMDLEKAVRGQANPCDPLARRPLDAPPNPDMPGSQRQSPSKS
ncbi:hypothetical protein H4R33_002893 [Dimargaris cristalligena]|nr:hypothetical protein H4R33_002893 [Dimargaris cristalligena]